MRAPAHVDDAAAARRRHYGEFYDGVADDGRRRGAILGNCQAESLRIALEGCGAAFVRVPPIHELVPSDMAPLDRLLRRVDVVIAQPVRDDYHDLPIGTRQLLARAPSASTAIVPVIRFTGLHPTQAIVRPPHDPGAAPPVVPYHDLRTLAVAAGRVADEPARLTVADVRREATASLATLRARETRHGAVAISDVLEHPTFEHMRTINHPGNPVIEQLARRVAAAAGLPGALAPVPRPLLDAIHAPRSAIVREAFDLADEPREHWLVEGRPVDAAEVHRVQLAWYRRHPDVVAAGIRRHREALERLGW